MGELAIRAKGDRFVPDGGHRALRESLRHRLAGRALTAVLFYCFDRRTRLLPFVFADTRMVPAGIRQVGASLLDAGFSDIRIVLQQWSPNVLPSRVRLDGRPPDVLMFSVMSLHAAALEALLRDVATIPEDCRPLTLVGGPHATYLPDHVFHVNGDVGVSADAACMGEDFVLLDLLDRLADRMGPGRSLRRTFLDAVDDGTLLDVPGLMYRTAHPHSGEPCLLNTGVQRLVQDLDELPSTLPAFRKVEPPHSGRALKGQPMEMGAIARKAPFCAVVLTQGCKFSCGYCPIPAYNQRGFRRKSGQRVAEELYELGSNGIRVFLGADDNFFNDRDAAGEICAAVARFRRDRRGDRGVLYRWGTESTLFDADRNQDLLPVARASGMQALWFGIEDLTADLVNKGQTADRTASVFGALRRNGILPMPMLMHPTHQPLWTRGGMGGLFNQIDFLRRAGAGSIQVTMLVPAVGTRWYEKAFLDGTVFESVGGTPVPPRCFDGSHVVTGEPRLAWRSQLGVLAGYARFYNPVNLIGGLFLGDAWHLVGMRAAMQVIGMGGVAMSAAESLRWATKLAFGRIIHANQVPPPRLPILATDAFRPARAG